MNRKSSSINSEPVSSRNMAMGTSSSTAKIIIAAVAEVEMCIEDAAVPETPTTRKDPRMACTGHEAAAIAEDTEEEEGSTTSILTQVMAITSKVEIYMFDLSLFLN